MTPEIIATSPLVRCVETARTSGRRKRAELKWSNSTSCGRAATWSTLLRWTARQARKHQQIAWVGHAPDVDRLAAAMIGGAIARSVLPKGSVAAVRFDGAPMLGGGELQWLVTAKVLGC